MKGWRIQVRRLLSCALALVMMVGLVPTFTSAVHAAVAPESDFVFNAATGTITEYKGAGGAVEIPATINGKAVKAIGEYSFHCIAGTSITSVIIPNGVTSIGGWAFSHCSALISITIPSSVTSIGKGAFSFCGSLESIAIPNSVTSIGESAFFGCENLTSVSIPEGITSISDEMFQNCSKLTTVIIPDGIIYIGNRAFYASGLTTVKIPSSVTVIGVSAFYSCKNLATVYFMHGDAKSLGAIQAFGGVASNFKIIYPKDATNFTSPMWRGYPAEPGDYLADSYAGIDLIVPGSVEGFSINLSKETITILEGYSVESILLNGTWKPVKDLLSEGKFPKLLNKDLDLGLSDKLVDRKTNKPDPDAQIVRFPFIRARPKAPDLKANYLTTANKTGVTNGNWTLVDKSGIKAVKGAIEIGLAAGKTVDEDGYMKFYVDYGIPINENKKTTYFIRYAPKQVGTSYTSASKPKKISVAGIQNAPKFKVKEKAEKKDKNGAVKTKASAVIAVKANTYVSINGGTPKLYTAKSDLNVLNVTGTIELWTAATAKKPASAKQVLTR